MKPIIAFALLPILLSYCTPKMEVNPYAGIWQSIGHGEILEISGEEAYAFYDITSISCVSRRTGPLAEITQALSLDSDTLSLSVGVITTRYTRTSTLPYHVVIQ